MEVKTGKFSISPDKSVFGELQIAGRQSSLVLRDNEFFFLGGRPNLCITGVLYDQTKVTLIDCIQTSATSHKAGTSAAHSHSVTLFPHFIAEGRVHFEPDKASIRDISFTFEDATKLFYDFDAFGAVIDAGTFIGELVKANEEKLGRKIRTGPEPAIAYFAGERLIAEADTAVGNIRVEHCPSWPFGGPRGVRIDNQIWVSIMPNTRATLNEAVDRVLILLRFIAIAVGRKQDLVQFSVNVGSSEVPQTLQLHWSGHPRRLKNSAGAGSTPQPGDLPLNPIHYPEEFIAVFKSWLAVDEDRRAARVRIDESVGHESHYTVDRLVGAANAFDLLPESAVPKRVDLTDEVTTAKDQCDTIVRALPQCDERQSLLNAIGRLGKASLKQKLRHRAKLIASVANDRLPLLEWVCNQAVDCRNHFVHGGRLNFEIEPPSTNLGFLTDTLEFVFTASELIEAGWNIGRFLNTPTSMSHPFGSYCVNYKHNLEALRASVKNATTIDDAGDS